MRAYGFHAVLALVGVVAPDRRLLVPPETHLEIRDWILPPPLPLHGLTGQGEGEPVGRIEEVLLIEETLWARGRFHQSEEGRHYAGALALGLGQIALDAKPGEDVVTGEPGKRRVEMRGWQVRGGTVVVEHAWKVPPVEVYQVPVLRGR